MFCVLNSISVFLIPSVTMMSFFIPPFARRLRCKPQLVFPCVLYVLSALTYVLQPYVGASLLVVVLVSTLLVGACGKHAMFTTVLCNTLADRVPAEERSARY